MSTYNNDITNGMFNMAKVKLSNFGIKKIDLIKVPGAFEIPGTINMILKNGEMDAIIGLGAVIRGETPHFDFVATESAHGMAELSRKVEIPIINGFLTTDDVKQAMNRSTSNGCNKGWDAMVATLQTISIYDGIKTCS